MENDLILDENHVSDNLAVSLNAKNYLLTISKWGKFLAILGFIFSGFALIGGFGIIASSTSDLGIPGLGGNVMLYMGLAYIIMAAIYGFLSYLLFSFCSNAKTSVDNTDSLALEKSINQLKKLFVIMGVTTIVTIVAYILFIVIYLGGIASTGF